MNEDVKQTPATVKPVVFADKKNLKEIEAEQARAPEGSANDFQKASQD